MLARVGSVGAGLSHTTVGQTAPSNTTFSDVGISGDVQRRSTETPVGADVVMTAPGAGTHFDQVVDGGGDGEGPALGGGVAGRVGHGDGRGVRGVIGDGRGRETQGGGGRVVGGGYDRAVDGGAPGAHAGVVGDDRGDGGSRRGRGGVGRRGHRAQHGLLGHAEAPVEYVPAPPGSVTVTARVPSPSSREHRHDGMSCSRRRRATQ